MSIYIPGMDMPTSCLKCPFCDDDFDDNYFGLCCLLTGTRFDGDERLNDCPLIEVPPHGRLGDLDALRAEFPMPSNWNNANEVLCHITGIWAEIDAAPTIIPADVADKDGAE